MQRYEGNNIVLLHKAITVSESREIPCSSVSREKEEEEEDSSIETPLFPKLSLDDERSYPHSTISEAIAKKREGGSKN